MFRIKSQSKLPHIRIENTEKELSQQAQEY